MEQVGKKSQPDITYLDTFIVIFVPTGRSGLSTICLYSHLLVTQSNLLITDHTVDILIHGMLKVVPRSL